jgi:hypothetical protein
MVYTVSLRTIGSTEEVVWEKVTIGWQLRAIPEELGKSTG